MILEYHSQLLKFSIPRNYFTEFKTFSFINYKLLLNGAYGVVGVCVTPEYELKNKSWNLHEGKNKVELCLSL